MPNSSGHIQGHDYRIVVSYVPRFFGCRRVYLDCARPGLFTAHYYFYAFSHLVGHFFPAQPALIFYLPIVM